MERVAVRPVVWVAHDSGDKNLSPATDFGDLRVLMSGASPPIYDAQHISDEIRRRMVGKDGIIAGDFLLLVGSPSICAIATAIAADILHGEIQMLQWDRQERRYLVVKCYI